ncbi:MAG: 2-hydroxychromene-2-carboxylate isomerase [Rhodospirillaceae bacterium]|nr:2-hydroxychromene-2-carboxylate isomerase [Rhodospirillaceae bacterium]|tara:strand:+ start:255 stop:869 length:615 start_codon:yes stop_codon:yes gene_type:complete
MDISVKIYSDYVCPFCFLAEEPLMQAVDSFDGAQIDIEWMPFELRPYPTPTLKPEGQYLRESWKHSVYPMAESMGIAIKLPGVSPQPYTRLAFEGSFAASAQKKSKEYNHRMFTAFFQDGLDIGKQSILESCAAEIGLDSNKFRSDLSSGRFRSECQRQLLIGRDLLKISSVPTFIINNDVRIPGVLSKETLVSIFEKQLSYHR